VTVEDLRANLIEFVREIAAVAEEEGVRLAIHPDDPAFPLFGLPRVMSTAEDFRHFVLNYRTFKEVRVHRTAHPGRIGKRKIFSDYAAPSVSAKFDGSHEQRLYAMREHDQQPHWLVEVASEFRKLFVVCG